MGEALQVNPYDIETMARVYSEALTMHQEERRVRMHALRERIAARDVHHWANSFIDSLESARSGAARPPTVLSSTEDLASVSARLRSAERLLLLLDYDGTLVPFARSPDLAAPDRSLRSLLAALGAKPGVHLHVVSGRRREPLERWLGDLPIGLHAEHGYWSRAAPGRPWVPMRDVNVTWREDAKRLLDEATATTPGALIEEKTASLAWHWRMAEPELGAARADELWRRLEHALADRPAELLHGEKVIEIRPTGVNKGLVVKRLLERLEAPLPTIAAMGDDRTDEDLFAALPSDALTIGVGFLTMGARYRVATPGAARSLLAGILGER
jgi:trehalose 6-phosphate synthase/phosphatase